MRTVVMWFRKDLRIEDNSALNQALLELQPNEQLLCLFQLNPQQFKRGTMNHDYFFSALAHFAETAKEKGLVLHFLVGQPITSFRYLKAQYPTWDKIYFNQDERGYGQERDKEARAYFQGSKITVVTKSDSHLHAATVIKKQDGTAYQKFTPYYNQWRKLPKQPYQPLQFKQASSRIVVDKVTFLAGETTFAELLRARRRDFSEVVGAEKAKARLNRFVLTEMVDYHTQRDFPSIEGTSQLSHYLRTGEVSIRQVWQAASALAESEGQLTFLKELCWRDFYNMIDHEHPYQRKLELKENYRSIPWRQEGEPLTRWQKGLTGFPLIDAGMRQLNETGWMHNRLRMIVASFLTKNLLTDWRLGAAYFSEQLIDFDPASNTGGWQWAASTGTDAVPYFRIFNPITQSKKFDKEGTFIRKYLPELANVPTKWLHEPYLMPIEEQEAFGCLIGKDYPFPIVDHQKTRQLALDVFKNQSKV